MLTPRLIRSSKQKQIIQRILTRRNDLIAILILLFVAIGVRIVYQHESIVNNPLRADAGKYFSAAYNLHQFGLYSTDRPRRDRKPPDTRTDLSPGYPLFLTLFMGDGILDQLNEFVARVLRVQAVMGALVAVFTFLTARLYLNFAWALLAGTLTAISPHLIALDGFFLTESLFTFVLMLGTLVLSLAWRTDRVALTLIGGLLLAASAEIRAVSYLLVFFLAPALLFVRGRPSASIKGRWVRHLAAIALSFFVVIAAHREFVKFTVTHEPGILAMITGKTNLHAVRDVPQKYVVFRSPWTYLKRAVLPPKFFVDGNSHVFVTNRDRNWKIPTEASFAEAYIAYIKWILVGKIVVLWHFDNAYNGDVYIYPMVRRGFDENQTLQLVHGFMRAAHWPLFVLSIAAPVILFVLWRKGTLPTRVLPILLPVLGFVYFFAVLWLLSWLPRYTIPVRPFSYILAMYSLSVAAVALWRAKSIAPVKASGDNQGSGDPPPRSRPRRNKHGLRG
ncbi:MAG: glycosyltransferase family 39 protein [Proteobacteria bacterium]|nr:glycosyltransferase family 39 protein [Pseudomonadota bacterium]